MFKGKVVLITGATSGIGRAFLEKFSANGATVIFNGFPSKNESIEEIQSHLKENMETESYFHSADMSNPLELENMIDEGMKRFSKIDILINNAGIAVLKPSYSDFPRRIFQNPSNKPSESLRNE